MTEKVSADDFQVQDVLKKKKKKKKKKRKHKEYDNHHENGEREIMQYHNNEQREGMQYHDNEETENMQYHDNEEREGMYYYDNEETESMQYHDNEEREGMQYYDNEERESMQYYDNEERESMQYPDNEEREGMQYPDNEEREGMQYPDNEEREGMQYHDNEEREGMQYHDNEERESMQYPDNEETESMQYYDNEVTESMQYHDNEERESMQYYDNEETESMQNAELGCAPLLLLEDQAPQSGEGCKKKKKKKKKRKREEQEALLENSYVELEHEISNETGVEAPRKKKKKKKHKHSDGADDYRDIAGADDNRDIAGADDDYRDIAGADDDYRDIAGADDDYRDIAGADDDYRDIAGADDDYRDIAGADDDNRDIAGADDDNRDTACVPVNQYTTDNSQDGADYVYLQASVKKKKKKKKKKLRAEIEAPELPTPETETHDEGKRSEKRGGSSTQDVQEDTGNQLPLSSPEQNNQEEDSFVLLLTEVCDVMLPQESHKDDDCDASPPSENSADVPANFSSPTKPANQSRNTARAKKVIKSRAFILEESSSESDGETPEPSVSDKMDKNSYVTEASDALSASIMDFHTIKQELEEFIPHVWTISDSSIKKIAGRDLVRFKEFKKQGIPVKFGRFTQKENNQIRKNVEEFLALTGIDSAEKLLFTSRYPEDKGTISRLKLEHLFCEKISEGIPRPWRLIYYRARKMFDPNNYKGRYSVEEKEKLKKYHKLHGNDWKKISEMMSRSNLSVAMKYSEIKSDVNYGPWSEEETQKLMHAMEEVIRRRMKMEDANSLPTSDKSDRDVLIDCEKLCQKLPWTEIEAEVGTRYWRQCKQKWTTILMNKMTKGQQLYKGTKQLQSRIDLIKRLYEMKAEDANEVNWEELTDTVGPVLGTYVRARFHKLKVSCVPFWQKKSFSEIVDYLYENKLPELEEQLEKRKGNSVSSDNSAARQQKKALRFCDIFDSSKDSD